jgi:hypothetical protein
MASVSSPPVASPYETNVSYQDQWRTYKESISGGKILQYQQQHSTTTTTSTVFDLAWWHSASANDDTAWLVGCTSAGEICIWRNPPSRLTLPTDDTNDGSILPEDDAATMSTHSADQAPLVREQVSNGVLYSIQVIQHSNERVLLVVAGDDGVFVYDWNQDILSRLEGTQTGHTAAKKPLVPLAHFRPHPSATEARIEINSVQLNDSHLFGAAGDAFGCYKWDLATEKLVANYRSPHHGYLHSVELVPNAAAGGGGPSNLLLTGGEDGILGIWDCAKDQLVDNIDTATATAASDTTSPTKRPNRKKQTVRRIFCILARDENWWTVAGSSSTGSDDKGGFLSTFHAPTRSLVATAETRETPQQLAFCNNAVVSVANESIVSHWDPFSLERTHRVWCRSPSAYAAAVAPDGKLAVGGVGNTVDLFEDGTQKTFHFSL